MCSTTDLSPVPLQGFLHRLDARVKLLAAIAVVMGAAFVPTPAHLVSPSWSAYGVLLLFLGGIAVLGRLSPPDVLARCAFALPFLVAATPLLFAHGGTAWARVGTWTITTSGVAAFASVALRALISVLAVVVLSLTTPFAELLRGLLGLRLSPVLAAIVSFMHRYGKVLVDEAARVRRAAQSRSARTRAGHAPPLFWRIQQVGHMVASLLVRSLDRSDRVYNAMLARGYDGRPRFMNPARLHFSDGLALGMVVAVVALAQMIAR